MCGTPSKDAPKVETSNIARVSLANCSAHAAVSNGPPERVLCSRRQRRCASSSAGVFASRTARSSTVESLQREFQVSTLRWRQINLQSFHETAVVTSPHPSARDTATGTRRAVGVSPPGPGASVSTGIAPHAASNELLHECECELGFDLSCDHDSFLFPETHLECMDRTLDVSKARSILRCLSRMWSIHGLLRLKKMRSGSTP